jgi:hypothetical protein
LKRRITVALILALGFVTGSLSLSAPRASAEWPCVTVTPIPPVLQGETYVCP